MTIRALLLSFAGIIQIRFKGISHPLQSLNKRSQQDP